MLPARSIKVALPVVPPCPYQVVAAAPPAKCSMAERPFLSRAYKRIPTHILCLPMPFHPAVQVDSLSGAIEVLGRVGKPASYCSCARPRSAVSMKLLAMVAWPHRLQREVCPFAFPVLGSSRAHVEINDSRSSAMQFLTPVQVSL